MIQSRVLALRRDHLLSFVTLRAGGAQSPRRLKIICFTNTNKVFAGLFQKAAGSRGGTLEKKQRLSPEKGQRAELSKKEFEEQRYFFFCKLFIALRNVSISLNSRYTEAKRT